jgi:hypothetical protein
MPITQLRQDIRLLLVLKDWTRTELATRLGIAENTLARWFVDESKASRRVPTEDQVKQIGKWLGEAKKTARLSK